jgi:hypothetical protein
MRIRAIVAVGIVGAWGVIGAACSGAATPSSASASGSETPSVRASATAASPTPATATTTPATPAAAATAAGTGHVWVFGDEAKYSAPGGAQGSGCAPSTNVNPKVWLLPVAGDIPAKKAAIDDGTFTLSQVIADPGGSEPTGAPFPAWIFINGGLVTELEVQFVP